MRKRRLIYKRKTRKRMLMSLVLVLFVFIGIGYATLSTNLGIDGEIEVSKYSLPIVRSTYYSDGYAFQNLTYRDKIKRIIFDNHINPPDGAIQSWDYGIAGNGNVT